MTNQEVITVLRAKLTPEQLDQMVVVLENKAKPVDMTYRQLIERLESLDADGTAYVEEDDGDEIECMGLLIPVPAGMEDEVDDREIGMWHEFWNDCVRNGKKYTGRVVIVTDAADLYNW